MGCVRKQVGWIGEDKMLERAGLLAKKNSVCQKLPQGKAHVHSVCNFCVDKLSICKQQEPMMVQVKWLKHSYLSSSASTKLKRLQLFLHGMELRDLWAGSAVSLDSAPTSGSTGGPGTQMPKWYWLDMNPAKHITLV